MENSLKVNAEIFIDATIEGRYHKVNHLFEVDLSGDQLKVVGPYHP